MTLEEGSFRLAVKDVLEEGENIQTYIIILIMKDGSGMVKSNLEKDEQLKDLLKTVAKGVEHAPSFERTNREDN